VVSIVDRFIGSPRRPRQRAHRVTTRHPRAAYPFQSQSPVTTRGCFIGAEVNGGGAFT
jgi:hypothetical protein